MSLLVRKTLLTCSSLLLRGRGEGSWMETQVIGSGIIKVCLDVEINREMNSGE